MKFDDLWVGGKQDWADAGGMELPVFAFVVKDIAAAERLLRGMYVEFDVRFDTSGALAYHLSVPDVVGAPWAIRLDPAQIPRVEEAARILNICMTMIVQPGHPPIKLTEFFEDLTHDWSGAYARGHRAFMANDLAAAEAALAPLAADQPDSVPAAHHLLGRCHRGRNDFTAAIDHYARAARAATHTQGHFLPRAASILSDMGVSYKKLGQEARAAHCLAHSLRLRPNHPAALGTYFTLFGAWEEGFDYVLTRIAAIGSEPGLLRQLAQAAAGALGKDADELLRRAEAAGRRVDLAGSPLGSSAQIPADEFFAGLAAAVGDAPRPTLTPFATREPGDEPASSAADAPAGEVPPPVKKPWWRFW
jgi:hypothetical protein